MKILLVTHGFPPHQTAGTESYAADLGVEWLRRGHAVRVFSARKDISRREGSLVVREWRGLVVHEITNNLSHERFEETYSNARIEAPFVELLREFAPDVVHVQHLLYLSSGCITAAKAAGASVVFTLHDFWLQCPRLGQRVHADGGLCDRLDFSRCGTCLTRFKWKNSKLERVVGGMIAELKGGTGIDLAPLARATAKRIPHAGTRPTEPEELAAEFARAAEERTRFLRERIVPAVDLFIAPSQFLRERFITEWKLAPAHIEHVRFGLDARVERTPRASGAPLRVAFIGSLVPLKGAHVLVDAWSRIDPALRAQGELVLYGPSRHHPEYQADLARAAAACGAKIGGLLERDRVIQVLAATDLLVVPSLWFENAPLVILEALAARTPLLVSDLGGMKELVERGVSGQHFAMGDVEDLSAKLKAALSDKLGLEQLYAHAQVIPSFAEHADVVEARYRSLRAATRS